jgi:hypothetical protein
MRSRWIQAGKPSSYSPQGYKTQQEGLAWWDSFFAYIAKDTKLAEGFESQGRTWKPDLEWIVNSSNFAKSLMGSTKMSFQKPEVPKETKDYCRGMAERGGDAHVASAIERAMSYRNFTPDRWSASSRWAAAYHS